jgi:hypothetical protein
VCRHAAKQLNKGGVPWRHAAGYQEKSVYFLFPAGVLKGLPAF